MKKKLSNEQLRNTRDTSIISASNLYACNIISKTGYERIIKKIIALYFKKINI